MLIPFAIMAMLFVMCLSCFKVFIFYLFLISCVCAAAELYDARMNNIFSGLSLGFGLGLLSLFLIQNMGV